MSTPEQSTDPLGTLGVDLSTFPAFHSFPKAFTRSALPIWKDLLESTQYADRLSRLSKGENAETKMWRYAVRKFLSKCSDQDIHPFQGGPDASDFAMKSLRSARQRLVDFIHSSKIFSNLKIASVERDFVFTANSLTVTVTACLKPSDDPTISDWLTSSPSPGFKRHSDGWLRKNIHTGIDLEFHPTERGGCLIYSITCQTPIRHSGFPSLPSLTNHAENNLWLPVCRELPIESTGTRSYF